MGVDKVVQNLLLRGHLWLMHLLFRDLGMILQAHLNLLRFLAAALPLTLLARFRFFLGRLRTPSLSLTRRAVPRRFAVAGLHSEVGQVALSVPFRNALK